MNFEEFISWVGYALINWQEFQTLGRRSRFHAQYDNQHGSITVRNSRDNQYNLNIEALRNIFERYITAPAGWMHRANYYTDPIWHETPNRVAAPYKSAIIKHWAENIL